MSATDTLKQSTARRAVAHYFINHRRNTMQETGLLSAQLASGAEVHRGDSILVEAHGHVCTATVNLIGISDGDPYVTASVQTGHIQGREVWEYIDGFRHVSSPHTSGKRFCLVSDGAEGEQALREHFQLVGGDGKTQPIEPLVDTQSPPATKGEAPAESFAPADANKDGVVTPKEQRRYDKEQGNA